MSRRSAPFIALLVLVLSGCFKIDLTIEVDEDGSGRIEGLVALDAEAAADLGSLFEAEGVDAPSRDELCDEFLADTDVPSGATTEPYEEGKFCGVRFSQEFTADEMEQVLSETFADGGTGDFTIRRDGEGWRFDATVAEEAAGDAEFFPDELFSDAEFIVRVKLPGRQVEHNADRIEGDGTLVWDLDPFDPGPALLARTEPGTPITGSGDDDGSNTTLIVVAVLVLAALAVGGWWWFRKRSATPDPATDPGEPATAFSAPSAPPGSPPPPPPPPPPAPPG